MNAHSAPCVLIAEDSPVQAEMLRRTIERAGYEAMLAGDGAEALALALQKRPAAVISDINMPVMNGFELCRRLKALPGLGDVPVILLTSLDNVQDVIAGLNAGADCYVTKPYDEDLLVASLRGQIETPADEPAGEKCVPMLVPVGEKIELVSPRNARQLIGLLVSTYESAVLQNRALRSTQESLVAANRELAASNHTLETAYADLRETQSRLVQSAKMASLGELVAGVAHEINNPLAFVLNHHATVSRAIGLLAPEIRPQLAPERLRLFDKGQVRLAEMATGLERIRDLVVKLRIFSRSDAGAIRQVDIGEAIDAVLTLLRHRTDNRIRITCQIGPQRLFDCYPGPFNQVLLNLLANAVDAIEGEGEITINTAQDGEMMRIEVADSGKGMAEAVRERIFEPFFTTKEVGQGTGLGLSIAFATVREHGGTLEAFSAEGVGTRMVVKAPIRQHVESRSSSTSTETTF